MKKVILFMVYYGKLPNYFDIWLKAAEYNQTIDFCIITDCIYEGSKLPNNIKLLYLPYESFKKRVQEKFDFKVSIANYGRISQFRPAFAYIFPKEIVGYDYWGFIECDLIPGDIRAFITDEILENNDKIFKLGHFQIFKNNDKMNTLFMHSSKNALSYKFAFSQNVLFFEELLGMHNIANSAGCKTYEENIFADIRCYELMFNTSTYGYNDEKYSSKCLFEYNSGKIYKYTIRNKDILNRDEVLYVHLQKRSMEINTDNYEHYLIQPNVFTQYHEITKDYFYAVEERTMAKEDAYCAMMKKKLDDAGKKRNKELCWWKLRLIRFRIRKHGGVDLNGK